MSELTVQGLTYERYEELLKIEKEIRFGKMACLRMSITGFYAKEDWHFYTESEAIEMCEKINNRIQEELNDVKKKLKRGDAEFK